MPGLVTSLLLVLFVFVVVHYIPPTSSAISSLFSVFSVCKPVVFLAVVLFTFLSYPQFHRSCDVNFFGSVHINTIVIVCSN